MSQIIRTGGVGFVLAAYLVARPVWIASALGDKAPPVHSWPFVILALGMGWLVAGFVYPVVEDTLVHLNTLIWQALFPQAFPTRFTCSGPHGLKENSHGK